LNTTGSIRNCGRWAARLGCVAVAAALTVGLGGCADQKKLTALENQVKDLQATNEQLASANRELQAQAALGAQRMPVDSGVTTRGPSGGSGGQDVVVTLSSDVLFDSGSANLKPTAKTELNKVASDLNGRYSGHRVRVQGFTDADPIRKSKFGSNEALSEARARSVEQYLASKGVDPSRMSSVGMGVSTNKGSKAANRRVEVVVIGSGRDAY
jgi:flagellar motor protein MotB